MANTLRIKRSTGSAAPTSLANAELAFAETHGTSGTLFVGVGTGGAGGTATTILAIGGPGSFLALSGTQTASGTYTFSGSVTMTGTASLGAATATTPTGGDNSTRVATTAWVQTRVASFGTGSVTSVGLSLPAIFSVSGSPVTTSGTLTASLASQSQNAIFAGPSTGGAGTPTFRSLVAADIPTITAAKVSDFDTQVRTSRLDQMAAPTADVSLNSRKITNLADPVSAQDAATKAYVDAIRQGLEVKDAVRVATTANITLSGTQTIDGVAVVAGDRVLVKDQTTGSANGIYVVAAGAWTRATDFDASAETLPGSFMFVEEGTTNADSGWVLQTNAPITLGTTSLSFAQFSGAGQITAGAGLTKTGNTLDVGAGTGIAVAADSVGLTGQALALHNLATSGLIVRTGAGTVDARTATASGTGLTITNGDGVAGNPTFALSAALSSVGGLTPAADNFAYYTGASTASLTSLSAFGRSLIDDADASTARSTLGLGTMSTQASSNVSITGGTLDNITIDGGTF